MSYGWLCEGGDFDELAFRQAFAFWVQRLAM
jgi:hypothetical protein